MIIGICAVDAGGGIGAKGGLPWGHNKEDMKFFRAMTEYQNVVMGRKTWDSLPVKPLSSRDNVIISSKDCSNGIEVSRGWSTSWHKDIYLPPSHSSRGTYIIGGSSIFKLYGGIYDAFIISNIEGVNDCDTYFPFDVLGDMVEVSIDGIRGKDNKLNIDVYISERILDTHGEYALLSLVQAKVNKVTE